VELEEPAAEGGAADEAAPGLANEGGAVEDPGLSSERWMRISSMRSSKSTGRWQDGIAMTNYW
jgi:hypothetical protein